MFFAYCYCAFDMLATVCVYLSRSGWFCKLESIEHVFIFTLDDNVAWMCLIFFFSFFLKKRENTVKRYVWFQMCVYDVAQVIIDSSSIMCVCVCAHVKCVWMKIIMLQFIDTLLLFNFTYCSLSFCLSSSFFLSHRNYFSSELFLTSLFILSSFNCFIFSHTHYLHMWWWYFKWIIGTHYNSFFVQPTNRSSGFSYAIKSITYWHYAYGFIEY